MVSSTFWDLDYDITVILKKKSSLHDFIKVVDEKDENILWLKIDKKRYQQ